MKRDIYTAILHLQDETKSYCDQINAVESEIESIIYCRDKKAIKLLFQLYDESSCLKQKWITTHTNCFLLKSFDEGIN
jgi:hypothetical protein